MRIYLEEKEDLLLRFVRRSTLALVVRKVEESEVWRSVEEPNVGSNVLPFVVGRGERRKRRWWTETKTRETKE